MKCKLVYWIILILFISFSAFKKVVANMFVRYSVVSISFPSYLFDKSLIIEIKQKIFLRNRGRDKYYTSLILID